MTHQGWPWPVSADDEGKEAAEARSINKYQQGWNDAAMGRPARIDDLDYKRGYNDEARYVSTKTSSRRVAK
jgi:hypothetical protein